jgi:hypothetical protein
MRESSSEPQQGPESLAVMSADPHDQSSPATAAAPPPVSVPHRRPPGGAGRTKTTASRSSNGAGVELEEEEVPEPPHSALHDSLRASADDGDG